MNLCLFAYCWTFVFLQIVNLDDVVDMKEISGQENASHFLTGPNRQSLKIFVVITPLSKYSQLWKIFLQFLVVCYHILSFFHQFGAMLEKFHVFFWIAMGTEHWISLVFGSKTVSDYWVVQILNVFIFRMASLTSEIWTFCRGFQMPF